MHASTATTRGVRVDVQARYLPERSAPDRHAWLFAYTIRITNEGRETVQLLDRHWDITDAEGERKHVDGPGVVGAQPVLAEGESFEYTSACPLETPFGTMAGHYVMQTEQGERFNAEVALFSLSSPAAVN